MLFRQAEVATLKALSFAVFGPQSAEQRPHQYLYATLVQSRNLPESQKALAPVSPAPRPSCARTAFPLPVPPWKLDLPTRSVPGMHPASSRAQQKPFRIGTASSAQAAAHA